MRFNRQRYQPYSYDQQMYEQMPMPPLAPQIEENYPINQADDIQRRYEYVDTVEAYGSIIKDLTDTTEILEKFELRLLGKKKLPDGSVVLDENQQVYIKDEKVAREFVDILRSVVNRHTDFSYFDESEAENYVKGSIAIICRWLMLQGEKIPMHYRYKLSFEAMALICASIHKATNGRMLVYTKGTFNVNESNADGRNKESKSILASIFPFMGRGKRYG